MSVCSPSRQSFLTGRRPDRNQVWNFIDNNPLNSSAIPGHFRDNGYMSMGLGKTFHEDGGAWNKEAYWSLNAKPYFPYAGNTCPHGSEGGGHCILPDNKIWDHTLLNASLDYLQFAIDEHLKNTSRPFFLMTGFRDPHAPWAAPPRMYALYNESEIAVAKHPTLGKNSPLISWSQELSVQLENGTAFPYGPYSPVPSWVAADQRHAYYAAVSYVDEHVGALLGLLAKSGLEDSTIVVFHSDHGYFLGENGEWEKKSNYDLVVRVPLIIKVPGKKSGVVNNTLLDLVDLYPTLSSLAGLTLPPDNDQLDGTDLSLLFDDPSLALKTVAYHQYPACGMKSFNETRSECNNTPKNQFNFMGYSIRTPEWRYTRWLVWNTSTLHSEWDGAFEEELYSHAGDASNDDDDFENENVALENPQITVQLFSRLRAFFDK